MNIQSVYRFLFRPRTASKASPVMLRSLAYYLYIRAMKGHFAHWISIRRGLLRHVLRQELINLVVQPGVYISGFRKLRVGRDVSINHSCFLSCEGGLEIGDYVAIGHGTSILTTEHTFARSDVPIKYQPIQFKPVCIGSNTWIGANVTILAGVQIAPGTVVAAGAVVTRSIDETDTIVAGIPARFIKHRLASAVLSPTDAVSWVDPRSLPI